jgi:hypothetical protein
MAREKYAHSRIPGGGEHTAQILGDFLSILDLPDNPRLHVIDDESSILLADDLFQ